MLNVEVFGPHFPIFDKKGYWIDFSESKLTFRNSENLPLFEIIHDRKTHENILMTRENVYYTDHIFICCDHDYHPTLAFDVGTNNFFTITITVDENGNELTPTL